MKQRPLKVEENVCKAIIEEVLEDIQAMLRYKLSDVIVVFNEARYTLLTYSAFCRLFHDDYAKYFH